MPKTFGGVGAYVSRRLRLVVARVDRRLPVICHTLKKVPKWGWLSGAVAVVFITSLLIYLGQAQALSQGPLSPATAADSTVSGGSVWSATTNALTSNSAYSANAIAAGGVSDYLTVTNFGFTVPTGSTINGIQADVEEYSPTSTKGTVVDNSVMSIKGGTIGGTSQALTSTWPSANTYVTYGSSSNLWGQTWAASDVDASGFGVAVSAKNVKAGGGATLTAYIDYVRVTVYYTPPPISYAQASSRLYGNQDTSSLETFAKTYGSTGIDYGQSVVQTSDGGYATIGTTGSYGAGNYDALLAKYNSAGTLSWSTTWGGTNYDYGNSVIQTSDGGYAIAGTTQSFGAGIGDAFLAKFTSTGALSWSTTWGGTGSDGASKVIQTADGGYVLVGQTYISDATNGDAFLAKFTSTGALSWSTTWGGTGTENGEALVQTADGGFAVAGMTASYGAGGDDAFLAKFTSTGALSWSTTWGGTGTDQANALVQTSDGGYAITGQTSSFQDTTNGDAFLAKFTSTGALSWSTTWGGTGTDYGQSIVQTSDGGYAITGETKSYTDTTNGDIELLKLDGSGSIAGCGTACAAPTATTTSPTATTSSPTATVVTPAPTTTIVVAVAPSIDVGAPLAALNTPTTVPADGQPFRLRVDVGITGAQLAAYGGSLKLQYAPMTTSCDASFTNTLSSAYQDVTDTSTLRYYDNANASSGLPLVTDANDPTDGSNPLVREVYLEKGASTFTNPTAIAAGSDGMWDFALTTYHATQNTSYCLRVVLGDGTLLNTYTTIAQVTTPASSYAEGGYRLFTPGAVSSTFAVALGNSLADTGSDIVQTSDGGFAVVGTTAQQQRLCTPTCSVGTGHHVFLTKYDVTGSISWSSGWSSSNGYDYGLSVVQTSDGGYAITGQTGTNNNGSIHYAGFLAKYTTTGTLSWTVTWGGGTTDDDPTGVIQTSDGGYAVAGDTSSHGLGGYDAFLAKFTSAGAFSWYDTWGSTGNDYGRALVQTSDGGYALTGYTYSYGDTTNGDAFLAKYDSAGNLSWSTTWGGTGIEQANAVAQTSDGGYAIAGYTTSFGAGGNDAFLAKFTSTGTLSWSTTWGGTGTDQANALVQASDGGYAITGQTFSYGDTANGDMFVARFDASGHITNCGTICTSPTASTAAPAVTVTAPIAATTSLTLTTASMSTSLPLAPTTVTTVTAYVGATVGATLTAQDKPYDAPTTGTQFRLRLLVDVANSGTAVSGQLFKLQYAVRGSDNACDTSFSGETYADVTTTTPIYYDAVTGASGAGVVASANDPADSGSGSVSETYRESNNFTNAVTPVYAGQSGLWDFSLAVQPGTLVGHDYCLRVVKSDGTLLNTYNNIVDIGYGPATSSLLRQEMWFNRAGVLQGFFLHDKP